MFDVETKWGQVHFSRDIIRQICKEAVNSCEGRVAIYNFHGKGRGKGDVIFQPTKDRAEFADIHIEGEDEALRITIYIVIGFGVSIKKTAEHIINTTWEQIEEVFGVSPGKVTVINTATASRDVIARHMEFVRTSADPQIVEV